MEFSVTITVKAESIRGQQTERHGASYWGNEQCRNEYNDILQKELESLGTLNIDKHNKDDVESVKESLDNYIDEVNNIIHSETVESGCPPQTHYKPAHNGFRSSVKYETRSASGGGCCRQQPSAYRYLNDINLSKNCFVVCVGAGYKISSSTIIPRQLAY